MIIDQIYIDGKGTRKKCVCICKCDTCEKEFTRNATVAKKSIKHYCCTKCINLGRKHTDECKKQVSDKMMGEGNPFYGKTHNDEMRLKISKNVKNAFENNPSSIESMKSTLRLKYRGSGNPFYGKTHSIETKNKMSKIKSEGISSGKYHSGTRGWHGEYKSIKTTNIEKYDSFYEYLRMLILDNDDNVLFWTKKHGIRLTYQHENIEHKYIPDFFIETTSSTTIIEEVKGYEEQTKLEAKINCLKLYCENHAYIYNFINYKILEELVQTHLGYKISQLRLQFKQNDN